MAAVPAPTWIWIRLLQIALATNCDAVHPGYGFLSESAALAARCAEAGLTFIGPAPATLQRYGDKGEAGGSPKSSVSPLSRGCPAASALTRSPGSVTAWVPATRS